jgi:hypothetical protein
LSGNAGSGTTVYRDTKCASATFISSIANRLPTHVRGLKPKGKYVPAAGVCDGDQLCVGREAES